jgi:uncharacterized damage-inducible protein DinB
MAELDRELPATRRVLERVPADRFGWKPHEKSLSAGQLAQHIAAIPGSVGRFAVTDGMDMTNRARDYASAESAAALMATLEASVNGMRGFLSRLDDAAANGIWRMTAGDKELFAIPRLQVVRTMCLNHWYHHRGELLVYLRLMGVPVPSVYGPTADERPF